MAVTNFIATVWSKKIQDELKVACKLVQNCTQEYEGDVVHCGTVKILGVGEPTIVKYEKGKGYTPEYMSDVGQELNIDQAYAFFFYVDDVDKAQSVPGLPELYQEKSMHGLKVHRDSYVADLIKTATNVTTAAGSDAEDVAEAIDNAITALRERNFDEPGVIEITPRVYQKFKKNLITLSTDNPEYIKRGIVGMYDGFEVVMSNNLAKDSTHAYCCVRGKRAIAFAGQINELEAMRAHDRFADVIRGLDTFGAKVIDQKRIQAIKVPVA